MKKYILISTLILINILFYFKNVKACDINNIDIELKENELGLVLFNYYPNEFILLKLNKKHILFIIDSKDIHKLEDDINNLKINLDYIIMNNDYQINIANKKVVKDRLTLNNIEFYDSKITYNNKSICINSSLDCDYNYITYNEDNSLYIKDKEEHIIFKDTYKIFKIK